jgi:prepilin-type N-terminal cleavage/methylation domain-containing protein
MKVGWVQKQSGFTIVELLIVIVVIGILAAISIVAYNGIQDRAEASKTAAAIQAYKKALQLYKIENGQFPTAGAMCLGDQYGTFTGNPTPSCRYSTSPIALTLNAVARDTLKPYLGGQLPMPSTKFLFGGTTEFIGAHFYGSSYNYTLDGKPIVMVEYYVKGDTCPVGPVYAITAPNFASPAISRSGSLGNDSRCFMPIANE